MSSRTIQQSAWGLTTATSSSNLPSDVAYTDVNNSWTTVQNLPNLSTIGTNVVLSATGLTAARTFTWPDLTDTVVTLTATQTLTGKTLTGNTAVNLVSGGGTLTLNTSGTITIPNATDTLVILGGTQAFTGVNTFNSGGITIWNPAQTFKYTITTSAITANFNAVLPLIPASDVFMMNNTTATIGARKTFQNTILALFNPGNTFSYIVNTSAITAARNVTLPLLTADDTWVFAAFAQTLTNKTIDAETNTPLNMNPMPSSERTGLWQSINANGTGSGSGLWATGINVAGTVTGNNPTATEGAFTKFDTSAVQNTQAGIRESTNFITSPGLNAKFKFKFQVNNTTGRFFIAILNSGTFQTGDEPLANLSGIAFGFRSTDTNWVVERNTGSATGTFDTAPGFGAKDTNVHTLLVFFNGSTNVQVTLDSTTATYSTTIPATSTTLTHQATITNSDAAASETFNLWYMFVRSDK